MLQNDIRFASRVIFVHVPSKLTGNDRNKDATGKVVGASYSHADMLKLDSSK